jgi:hypothetical protein
MRINIEFIPAVEQRYPTCGDYWIDERGDWQIRVSNMQDDRSMKAVAIHELEEMILVVQRGIPIESIDKFDMLFEQQRRPNEDIEPGDSPAAPYHEEHTFATAAERQLCEAQKLSWTGHCAIVKASLA